MSTPQESTAEMQPDFTVMAIRQLTAELPLNDFGLPTGIYRTDLLPYHEYIPPGTRVPDATDAPDATTDTTDTTIPTYS